MSVFENLEKDNCYRPDTMNRDERIADTLKCLRSKPGRPNYLPWYMGSFEKRFPGKHVQSGKFICNYSYKLI